jgi:hypothetical protein
LKLSLPSEGVPSSPRRRTAPHPWSRLLISHFKRTTSPGPCSCPLPLHLLALLPSFPSYCGT